MLALSALLGLVGIAARSSHVLLGAACLSFAFGIAAILSIGFAIIVIGILQVAGAIWFHRDTHAATQSR